MKYYIRHLDGSYYGGFSFFVKDKKQAEKYTEEQIHKNLSIMRKVGVKVTFERVK